MLTSFDVDALEELNLYVGAMASATFQEKVAGIDPRSMILITGDRENIQRDAVDMGVRVLIVTGSLQVAPDIIAKAEEQQVSILSTSFDTATSAWLSRLSTPVKFPTTTQIDREMATWLGRLAGLDPAEFGRRIIGAGSALAAYPTIRALVLGDFKEYTAGDQSFGVGQVEVVNFQEFFNLKGKIQEELAKIREERGLNTAALLVTDIVQETSLLLAFGGKEFPYVIGYPQLEDNLFELRSAVPQETAGTAFVEGIEGVEGIRLNYNKTKGTPPKKRECL